MGSGQSLRTSGLGTPAALVRTGRTVVSTTALMAHLCSKPTSLRGLTWPPCTHPHQSQLASLLTQVLRVRGQEVIEGRTGSSNRSSQSSSPQAELSEQLGKAGAPACQGTGQEIGSWQQPQGLANS